ncbi:hypothetical protein [Thalassobacillus pellis]|uniref:hypothetical protein n=1 Tax=Thalassobacillus pellis TaxID=748008 RepID=UPI00195F80BA|nr:hypothetical protein [Thalassobacillus pellis]MBM7554427.1 hypothetical protein [Thalassobacillus pellis]
MKRLLVGGLLTVMLVSCSNNTYGLDKEDVEASIAEEAVKQKVLEDGGYKESDIKITKICKVMDRSGEVELEDVYRVYWQTTDKKHSDKFILEKYQAEYGNNNYVDIENSCREW